MIHVLLMIQAGEVLVSNDYWIIYCYGMRHKIVYCFSWTFSGHIHVHSYCEALSVRVFVVEKS